MPETALVRGHDLLLFFEINVKACIIVIIIYINSDRSPLLATRYYTYVFFTMNATFNMCGVC